jgi:hypothetical protein
MDFRGDPDGEYKWILQIKDNFSRFVWLFALKDKASATICTVLITWFFMNGYPAKVYVPLLIIT